MMHSKLKADAVLVLGEYTSEKWAMHSKLKEDKIMNIKIYTDGACSDNPGHGGCGMDTNCCPGKNIQNSRMSYSGSVMRLN